MENIYSVYTREVNGTNFYFVKKFKYYSEYSGNASIMEGFGMHTDFFRACEIAKIREIDVIQRLMEQVHIYADTGKIISMKKSKQESHSLLRNTQHAILKWRFLSFN